jgi:TonB-linked SusC/RagA family outer membrane protein
MKRRCTRNLFNPVSQKSTNQRWLRGLGFAMLMILINFVVLSASAQSTIKVSGVVKDSKGATLPGVSVKVKGTSIGSLTDIDGKYALSAPNSNSVLVFSYIGYVTKESTVGTNTTINVTLADNATDLSEVVVTGYGQTVKKRDLTGSIGTVSAKQIQERQPVTLFDALQGQVAGAQVVLDGGDPFSQGTIQIRGASTLNAGNGPLYVIDGVINNDAQFLNPADIASIEVLKDAASSSIYGARGANGVIIITTKRGQDGKPNVNVNYYHLFGKLAHKLQTVSADDLRYYRKLRGDGNNGINADSVNHYLNADNDYQDLLFRTGNKDNINLNVSGGQKGLTYYAGATYYKDQSIVLNSYAQRVQGVLNVDYQATPKLKISNNVTYAYQTGNSIDVGTTAKQVFERNPWTSIYKPDGTLAGYVESKRNPVAYALLASNKPTLNIAQNNTTVNYEFIPGLRATTSFNARLDNTATQTFSPTSLTSGGTGLNTGGTENERKFFYEWQTYLNYNKTFGKDHTLSAVAGFSRDRMRDDDLTFAFQNYLTEQAFTSNIATIDLTKTNTTATYSATESIYARAQYSYKDRYIINGTFRRDGSSRFGPNNKWGNFGAGGLAWRFSDEPFMKWAKSFLDDAKLRYSLGITGNDKLSDFANVTLLTFGNANGNSGVYNGNSGVGLPSQIGNPTIHWESTTQHNVGIDFTMLKGRLTFTPEYYNKTTNGLLYAKSLPEETGFLKGLVNLGTIQNSGVELTATGIPIQKKDFSWTVTGNVSFQTAGLVKSLSDHTPFIAGTSYLINEGGHIGDFYLFKNLGVYQYDVSNSYDAAGNRLTPVGVSADGKTAQSYTLNGQTYTGTIRKMVRNGNVIPGGGTIWQDTNNDGLIDDRDRVVLGNAIPKVYLGFNNFFRYKDFTLNFLFNAQFGNKVYNSVANGQNANSSTYSPPTVAAIYNSWHKQGDIAVYPNFPDKDTYGSISNGTNSLYLENGAFIRLSSARLTYNLSSALAQKVKTRSVSVYVYGNNLVTWTNYSWYDPEFTSTNVLTPGTDSGKYPKRREVGLGLTVNF